MADYPIISDVSSYIVRMLREKMCPEPIPSPNNIEISSPASQDVDYIVGLYLYDIREDMEVAQPKRIQKGRIQLQKPPRPYDLFYIHLVCQKSLQLPNHILYNFPPPVARLQRVV